MRNTELKKKYIQTAFEIIQQEGRIGVSIRRLAKELDCNAANLYRCFADLDELFLYTGLKYVEGYLNDLRHLMEQGLDSMQMFLGIWNCFMKHSFLNPKMFNSMYFGKYSKRLIYATQEYFTELFPEELVAFDEEARETFMNGSFATGDSTISKMMMRCVEDGYLSASDRKYLDKLLLQIYKGYLKDFVDGRFGQGDRERVMEEVNHYFSDIISKYRIS